MSSSDQMRILHVSTPASWRGGEQQMAYLVEELNALGVQQWIACTANSEMENRCKANGWNYKSFKKRAGIDPFYAKGISKMCRKYQIDLVHTHDAHAHTFAILSVLLFGNKAQLIVSRRVDFPIKSSWFSALKYNHKSVARIVCVSDAIKKITSAGIKNKEVLTTVHSGIDTDKFNPKVVKGRLRKEYGIRDDQILIGNVAAIAPHKDYYTFVDTIKKLVEKGLNAAYLIIGDGPMRDAIEEYIGQQGLNDQIIRTGFRNDIAEILPELDVFLITSETEGLGTSILDAFASKVPVVATRAGGIPEIVIHKETGLLANVKDAQQLADNVLSVANDRELCQRLTEGASQKLQDFTKSATAQKTLAVYRDVLG